MGKDCKIRLEWVPEAYKDGNALRTVLPGVTKATLHPIVPDKIKASLRGRKQSQEEKRRHA